MYLNRFIPRFGGYSLTYDAASGGADFIVNFINHKIIIEVGTGEKNFKQIINTSKKVSSKYGLIISNDDLSYDSEINAVKIPLKYFLLI
ncbi:MAG: hypothetical protein HY934_04865 [Candidatus Firestonebacteria bacterium]|nr:hypothetical protein [Candidatus Firestonebacteria bacterium]